jgi:[ribosomal protein S5]-alanine N-acetyltransferase
MPIHLDCGCCLVRSWRAGDEDSLARHANDRGVWLNLRDRFPHPYTPHDAEQWVRFAPSQIPETAFAIDLGGEAVGGIGVLLHQDIERCSAEIGYWLGRQFWGRGLATAAVRGLTAHAFGTYGLTRVYALPFADNAASLRVLEKAGYRLEGRLRRSAVKDGVVKDQAVYAVTDEDLGLGPEPDPAQGGPAQTRTALSSALARSSLPSGE